VFLLVEFGGTLIRCKKLNQIYLSAVLTAEKPNAEAKKTQAGINGCLK
jgi:hypothetical protein